MAQGIKPLLTLILVHTYTYAGGHFHGFSLDGSLNASLQLTECRHTKTGQEYRGTLSVTKSMRQCQRWESQNPHSHDHTDPSFFPDACLKDAANHCRNPSGSESGPWCYTKDPKVRKEVCNVPFCACKRSKGGEEFLGTVSVTRSGQACDRWDGQLFIKKGTGLFKFPDVTLGEAANYCRNPSGRACGPWCYTGNSLLPWQYCDIPLCEGDVIIPTLPAPTPTEEDAFSTSTVLTLVVSGCIALAISVLVILGIKRRVHRDTPALTARPAEDRDDDMVYDNPLYHTNDTIANVRVIQRLESMPDGRRY